MFGWAFGMGFWGSTFFGRARRFLNSCHQGFFSRFIFNSGGTALRHCRRKPSNEMRRSGGRSLVLQRSVPGTFT